MDRFKLWYSGSLNNRKLYRNFNKRGPLENVVGVRRINDKMMTIKIVIEGNTLNIISMYAL